MHLSTLGILLSAFWGKESKAYCFSTSTSSPFSWYKNQSFYFTKILEVHGWEGEEIEKIHKWGIKQGFYSYMFNMGSTFKQKDPKQTNFFLRILMFHSRSSYTALLACLHQVATLNLFRLVYFSNIYMIAIAPWPNDLCPTAT